MSGDMAEFVPNSVLESRDLLNARFGLSMGGGRYDAAIWIKNLLDQDYYKNGFSANGFLPGFPLPTTLGDPRTFGVEVGMKWE
ncbi:MAG: hypothetical protein AB7Q97_27175 [Gammaproteobacteria bacterium]